MARAALSYYQDPPFTAVLGAVNSPLSSDMMHAHKEGSVGLRLSFFFFPVSFLFHVLEIHVNRSKRQLCSLVCNFIDFGTPYFDYHLFCF